MSFLSGLTSKGQVDVLLWEHRGWILRMAALIKGRLSDDSDVRPEAFAASFQTRRNARMPKPCKRKTAENFPFWRERGDQPAAGGK